MASDSDGDEDFVTYGTPLEPLEEDEPLRKPVPLHDQTVKDERGRYQRFHGAFTGGFSAGYFNTVGTKEGWAPSTFVSSRQQKAGRQDARPEDFMDEEDFGEHGIAPREITTSQEFSSGRRDAAAEKKRAVSAQAALIPGDTLLEELIAPARSSIGVELLRRMGWREGQGVGPRVKRRARRQQIDGVRGYGCVPPPAGSEESEDDDDEFAPENVTFAPKDVTPVDFSPKPGVQGLGYRGLDPGLALVGRGAPEHIDLFRPQSETRSHLIGDKRSGSRRGGVAGQAFGVGAMEDDDDEEVYHRDSMSRYDTVLGGEEPGDGLYGWTAPQQYTKKREKSKDASYLGKILEGFTLAQKPGEEKTIFPPPDLPRDYRPVHRFRPSVDVSVLSGVSPALAEALKNSKGRMVKEEPEQGGRHQLDSGQRGALLGEDALQGPSSVMELLRPADRHRLLSLRNSFHQASAPDSQDALRSVGSSGASPSSGPQQQQQQEALAAWRGVQTSSQTFRPFEKNPSKQARYELYVNSLRQGDKGALDQSVDPAMTEWERSRERDEFIRSSILYRPSSTSLSSRFTRGKHEADEDTVEVSRDEEGDVDDKQAAVEMKLFGKLTRETFEWHPDKLLCKRFNVPNPFPGSGVLGLPKVKRDKFSVFNFLTVTDSRETAAPSPAPPPAPLPEPGRKSRWDVSEQKKKNDSLSELLSTARNQTEIKLEPTSPPAAPPAAPSASISSTEMQSEGQQSLGKKKEADEEEEEEEEEDSRPPMDLFKAIFASSSEEKSSSSSEGGSDDEEDEKKNKEEGKSDSQPPTLFNVTSSSITSSVTSSSVSSSAATCSRNIAAVSCQTLPKQEEEEFGPKLPPPSAALTRGGAASARSPGDEEKPSKRSKEKKVKNKKQHKHKKEKKKKKHKKHKVKAKKKSKKEMSDSSSGDSDEDGGLGHLSTDELLKRLKSVRSHQTW